MLYYNVNMIFLFTGKKVPILTGKKIFDREKWGSTGKKIFDRENILTGKNVPKKIDRETRTPENDVILSQG